jgi:uroporphyrinogen-III decarboxylase
LVAASRALRGHACICGNVPGSLVALGTARDVAHYVSGLLDEVAADGGFILAPGVVVDHAKPETLRAMLDGALTWRTQRSPDYPVREAQTQEEVR